MDPVDKYPEITEQCKGNCVTDWQNYEACKVRIAQKGHGDCEPWYFDFYKCVDRCRVPRFKEAVVRK